MKDLLVGLNKGSG